MEELRNKFIKDGGVLVDLLSCIKCFYFNGDWINKINLYLYKKVVYRIELAFFTTAIKRIQVNTNIFEDFALFLIWQS